MTMSTSVQNRTVIVTGLPVGFSRVDVNNMFKSCGPIKYILDKTAQSVYIVFYHAEAAELAAYVVEGNNLEGCVISVLLCPVDSVRELNSLLVSAGHSQQANTSNLQSVCRQLSDMSQTDIRSVVNFLKDKFMSNEGPIEPDLMSFTHPTSEQSSAQSSTPQPPQPFDIQSCIQPIQSVPQPPQPFDIQSCIQPIQSGPQPHYPSTIPTFVPTTQSHPAARDMSTTQPCMTLTQPTPSTSHPAITRPCVQQPCVPLLQATPHLSNITTTQAFIPPTTGSHMPQHTSHAMVPSHTKPSDSHPPHFTSQLPPNQPLSNQQLPRADPYSNPHFQAPFRPQHIYDPHSIQNQPFPSTDFSRPFLFDRAVPPHGPVVNPISQTVNCPAAWNQSMYQQPQHISQFSGEGQKSEVSFEIWLSEILSLRDTGFTDQSTVERLYYGHPWDWPLVAVIEAWP